MTDYNFSALPVRHVRHRIDISRPELRRLAEENRIAVHWYDIKSRDPEAYREKIDDPKKAESAADDIEAVNEIDDTGAIVVADYSSDHGRRKGIHKSKLFAGVIPPGTFEYREYQKESGSTGIYKTLQFDEDTYTEIRLTDRPDLFSDVPARGTINPCVKTRSRLRELIDPSKSVSKTGPEHLDYNQFEHICVQFLSLIEFPGEFYTTTPVGGKNGNQQLIDINGGVGDTPVVGQVTTATNRGDVESKLTDLAEGFGDGTIAFFFGPQKYADEFNKVYEAVEYIGDEEVFDSLASNEKTRPLLDRVLRR